MAQNEPKFELNQFLLESLFEYSSTNPRDLTHIAIGSSPRFQELEKFTPDVDQLLPVFMLKEIESTRKTIRIIHIDQYTERFLSFLHEYFASYGAKGLNFKHNDSEGFNIWTSNDERIEVIFLFINIRHGEPIDRWFLERMIDVTLHNKSQLIVQEYTGYDIIEIAKFFFNKSDQKEMFLNHILFDVTYADGHCMPDMTMHYPRYKSNGTFYNFQFYNNQQMLDLVGTDEKINNVLKDYFLKEYKQILTQHHYNYRRKIQGLQLAYQVPEYNSETSEFKIMEILINKLNRMISIFERLGFINEEKRNKINKLFSNYIEVEMREWFDTMNIMFD